MRHIVTFSGGKDSLATLLFVRNLGIPFETVFCDTGWESPVTIKHISNVEKALDLSITRLAGKYDFQALSRKKKRVASTKARFCTEWLKVRPMIDYILSIEDDVMIYQGIRADESPARQKMSDQDDFFRQYDEGGQRLYRPTDVREWSQRNLAEVVRPIFSWTSDVVFDYIKSQGIAPNPLYSAGFSRVGCFPCVMCRHSEMRQIVKLFPERIAVIRKLEDELGRSFFPVGYIPSWACRNGEYPLIDDVVRYLHNPNQKELFPTPTCQSIYSVCE